MIRHIITSSAIALGCLSLAACPMDPVPKEVFFERILEHCGKAYEGMLVSTDEVDAGFRDQRIIMHVRACNREEIRIPLHVGDDHSRTWVITLLPDQDLQLKHDHRHEDGSADDVTMYGGDTIAEGSFGRQEFPADEFSKAMFEANDIGVSAQNTWAMEIDPETEIFAYEMSRPNRFFRIEFDLSTPVEAPPAPWGAE